MRIEDQVFSLLKDHLNRQDKTLEQILVQAKITNGRVNSLEGRVDDIEEASTETERRQVRKSDRRRGWLEIAFGGVCVLLAGVEGQAIFHWLTQL